MGSWVNKDVQQVKTHDKETFSEKFSIGSLLYMRLRRVTSRVIDVMYLSENDAYAHYVVQLAMATDDNELHRLAYRIQELLPEELINVQDEMPKNENYHLQYESEPSKEALIRKQLAQRYIDGLR